MCEITEMWSVLATLEVDSKGNNEITIYEMRSSCLIIGRKSTASAGLNRLCYPMVGKKDLLCSTTAFLQIGTSSHISDNHLILFFLDGKFYLVCIGLSGIILNDNTLLPYSTIPHWLNSLSRGTHSCRLRFPQTNTIVLIHSLVSQPDTFRKSKEPKMASLAPDPQQLDQIPDGHSAHGRTEIKRSSSASPEADDTSTKAPLTSDRPVPHPSMGVVSTPDTPRSPTTLNGCGKQGPDKGGSSEKPPYSYAQIIIQAILTSPDQRLTLGEIYHFITTTFPYYKPKAKGWQNSVRHNLSLNRYFIRSTHQRRDGRKGSFWSLDPEFADILAKQAFLHRRNRNLGLSVRGPCHMTLHCTDKNLSKKIPLRRFKKASATTANAAMLPLYQSRKRHISMVVPATAVKSGREAIVEEVCPSPVVQSPFFGVQEGTQDKLEQELSPDLMGANHVSSPPHYMEEHKLSSLHCHANSAFTKLKKYTHRKKELCAAFLRSELNSASPPAPSVQGPVHTPFSIPSQEGSSCLPQKEHPVIMSANSNTSQLLYVRSPAPFLSPVFLPAEKMQPHVTFPLVGAAEWHWSRSFYPPLTAPATLRHHFPHEDYCPYRSLPHQHCLSEESGAISCGPLTPGSSSTGHTPHPYHLAYPFAMESLMPPRMPSYLPWPTVARVPLQMPPSTEFPLFCPAVLPHHRLSGPL